MKLSFFIFTFLLGTTSAFSQNFSVQSSEVFKRSRGESVPDLIGVNETGIYLSSFTVKRKYMSKDHGDNMFRLIKYDLNYKEQFSYKYENELNKSEVINIFLVGGKLYLFSFEYEKKQRIYRVYGTTINQDNGKFEAPLKEVTSVISDLEYQAQIVPAVEVLPGSSSFAIYLFYREGKEDMSHIAITDFGLTRTFKTSYKMSAGDEMSSPADIALTNDKGLLLLESNYGPDPNSKKKNTEPVITSFSLSKFSVDGKRVYTNKIKLENKFLIKGKISITSKNELLLAGLFCNSSKLEEITGFVLNKYDVSSGALVNSSEFIPPADIIKNDEARKKVFGRDKTRDAMINNMRTPAIINNPVTNTTLLLTEFFSFNTSEFSTGPSSANDYSTNFTFLNGPLLFVDTDQNNQLSKISSLPKNQVQKMVLSGEYGSSSYTGAEAITTGFAGKSLDLYSSAGIHFYNDKMLILINDNPANGRVIKTTDNAKIIDDLSNSTTFILTYDFATGAITRKQLFNNSGMPIPMVKDSRLVGNDIFLFARLPNMLGKSDYKFIRITIK